MNLFNWIFRRKTKKDIPPIPSREAIIALLYDKHLDSFADEVVDVIYSKDKSMRYVILKNKSGLFTYQLEAIYQYDNEEWKYIFSHNEALPAMWEPFRGLFGKSLFSNTEELINELKSELEYKQHF